MPDYEKAESYILNRLKNELSPTLYYHGYHHTLDVMGAAVTIADSLNILGEDKDLLRVAVAFHDAGFLFLYKDHEMKSCEMAREALPSMSFSKEEIEKVCGMIMATKLPQQPVTLPEQIIADADLDYLGRDDAESIAQSLFEELKIHAGIATLDEWNKLQINFLNDHTYFTSYSISTREEKKQEYLQKLLLKN